MLLLGHDLVAQICTWLTHRDWSCLSRTDRALHAVIELVRASLLHAGPASLGRLDFTLGSITIGRQVLAGAHSLQSLVLRGIPGVDDRQLKSLAGLPTLRTLDLASTDVTSRGIPALWPLQALESLDLTFCSMVSYAAVLELRRECPNLRLIRRRPAWLDGKFELPSPFLTPSDPPAGRRVEMTHYPCGAFTLQFGTGEQPSVCSEGWVAQMRDHGDYLEDRLIFADRVDRLFNGRFGRLFKPLGSHAVEASSRTSSALEGRRLLLVQSSQGPEPPQSFPMSSMSTSPSFDLPHVPPDTTMELAGGVKVSNMDVRPLEPGCTAPPPELEARLRAYCDLRLNTPSGEPGHLRRRGAEAGALISIRSRVFGIGSLIDVTNPMGDRSVASRFARVVDDLVADRLDVDGE